MLAMSKYGYVPKPPCRFSWGGVLWSPCRTQNTDIAAGLLLYSNRPQSALLCELCLGTPSDHAMRTLYVIFSLSERDLAIAVKVARMKHDAVLLDVFLFKMQTS